MPKVKVYNINGEVVKELDVNPAIFEVKANKGLIQQVVEAQLANARQVLAHTKNRGDVSGGGKKPWKQKGTGRARHGSIRSPLWVGGGVVFGPRKDSNFSKKINKTMKKKALFMCLSDKIKNNQLVILDELKLDQPKTKTIINILKKLPVFETKNKTVKIKSRDKKVELKTKEVKQLAKVLLVIPETQENIFLSLRNITKAEVIRADSLNIVDLLKYKYTVMPINSIGVVEKTYLK